MSESDSMGAAYEQRHVHEVYESIAAHFSQTRYKPWPIVAEFLDQQPAGSLGLDVGSGNGKYLHGHNVTNKLNKGRPSDPSQQVGVGGRPPGQALQDEPRYFLLGLDRSVSLLSLSQHIHSEPELVQGDCLSLPFRSNLSFDFAISIATLHHLSTPQRRLAAVKLLLSSVKPTLPQRIGRILIFVWAQEQGEKSRRKWAKGTLLPAPHLDISTSQSETDLENLSNLQDVLVPWVLNHHPSGEKSSAEGTKTYNRYYHLFCEGELIQLVQAAAESMKLPFRPFHTNPDQKPPPQYSQQKDWCLIKRHGWEADNWWVEVELGTTG
ncbi:hypothetical protein PCANC_09310 [Puccinia coronata f. sp. avenae]|uniref:Methyltransferase type 11 domain-containing protein n=1 Tax=Puccinia coronata f. sp. avenae TaxID=200324 RepID=A0A2N5T5N3_9BASI|nr:hypothetical protein PCANC_09310 [Puccinia coronata f. sp. avenae]PLW41468.1 hypothetical protein PCASD_07177 [Puccinia coronata f. sp. avenae]